MMRKFLLAFVLSMMLFVTVSCDTNGYLIKFDSDGAGNIASQSVAANGYVEEPTAPVKEGYTFLGWYLEDELYDFSQPVTTRFELVAKWEIKEYQVIIFDGLSCEPEILFVKHGDKVEKPADPVKEGHTFLGWFANGKEYDFDTVVKEEISIGAMFDVITYEVTFDVEGVEKQTINHGDVATKPADPVKEGYAFLGWYANGAEYDFESPVVAPVELAAKWVYELTMDQVVGSWSGKEDMSGMELAVFNFSFAADGSAKANYSMSGYNMDMEVTSVSVVDYKLVVNYVNNGNPSVAEFEYVDGQLVSSGIIGGSYSRIVLDKKNIEISEVVGTWVGAESYSGVEMPYVVVINEDGTVSASIDMFGSVFELAVVEVSNKLVFDYYGMNIVFIYDGTQFVGTGVMGGQVVLGKKAAEITVESLAGTWEGVEETAYGNYNYVFKLNADGTGTGNYVDEDGLYPADITVKSTTVNGNSVVMVVETYGMEYTIEFAYNDGKLVSQQGLMWGALTIEKTISLEDVAGTWTGSEEFYGMVFEYEFVINADGTGTAKYNTSYGATIMTVDSYAIVDGKVVLTYNVDGYPYDPITLELVDGNLQGVGPMGTVITLTKQVEDVFTIEGSWTGVEETAYGNYHYQFSMNADGTGTGSYADEDGLFPADIVVKSTSVDGDAVVMVVETYGMEYTIEFVITDGELVSQQGLMWGSLTLSK